MSSPVTVVIPLPFGKPLLTMNQRRHHFAVARDVKVLRQAAAFLMRKHHVPRNQSHVVVSLHYTPRDNRRRDADNLVPTLKALCDGIVDAGIVADDTPTYMTKHMPVITPADKDPKRTSRLTLTVACTPPAA